MVTSCWCAHLNIIVAYRRVPPILGWMEGKCASSTRFHKNTDAENAPELRDSTWPENHRLVITNWLHNMINL